VNSLSENYGNHLEELCRKNKTQMWQQFEFGTGGLVSSLPGTPDTRRACWCLTSMASNAGPSSPNKRKSSEPLQQSHNGKKRTRVSYSCSECHRRKQKVRHCFERFLGCSDSDRVHFSHRKCLRMGSAIVRFHADTVSLGRFQSYAMHTNLERVKGTFTSA
jgi:hypothetical protein